MQVLNIHICAGLRYPCTECDHQATTQGNLTTHFNSKHAGVKYPCTDCNYQATTQGSLTVHTNSKHAGIRYLCT